MDADRAPVAAKTAAPLQVPGTQAGRRPGGADGHPVRAQERHPLGNAASRARLLRDDVLAALARLAAGRGLGTAACDGALRVAPTRATRSVTRGRRFLVGAGGPRGKKAGPHPTDRRKAGTKHHLITDAHGVPLAAIVTGANAHDVTQLLPLVDAIPPIGGQRGAPCFRPQRVLGDRAYDSQPHGTGLGTQRWVVERTIAWLHQFRRLRVRYEKRADIHEAFLSIGCGLICFRTLKKSFC